MVRSQPSVRMETCECAEVQEDRAGHPLSEGQGMDRNSGLDLERGKCGGGPWPGGKPNGGPGGRRIGAWHVVHRRAGRIRPRGGGTNAPGGGPTIIPGPGHIPGGASPDPPQGASVAGLQSCRAVLASHSHRRQ